jgi:hypothetical protein
LIEKECWLAWEKSKQNADSPGVGNVAFLSGVLKISQERSKLLALYPKSDKEEQTITIGNLGEIINNMAALPPANEEHLDP